MKGQKQSRLLKELKKYFKDRLCSESKILHDDEDNKAKFDRVLRHSVHTLINDINDLKQFFRTIFFVV